MSNIFSRFESNVENAIDAAAGTVFKSPIEPAQIAKKAEKQMKSNRLVGAGRQYAPTLYNVLVSSVDNKRLFGFYPTMAAELETYLMAKGADAGLNFDGRPLVRFIVDEGLKKGKVDVIVENVASPVIRKLREEEMAYYGISSPESSPQPFSRATPAAKTTTAPAATPVEQVRPPQHSTDGEEPRRSRGDSALVNLGEGTSHRLNLQTIGMGRGSDNDIVLNDANASRNHAQLTQDATGVWKITDLGSTNGTLLNKAYIKQALLNDGDIITIGLTSLEFRA